MSSNRLHIVPGTTATFVVDLVDQVGDAIAADRLVNAGVKVRVRQVITGPDVLMFATPDLVHLVLDPNAATLTLTFTVADTNALTVGTLYYWQTELDLGSGEVSIPVDWTPVDVDLGGSAAPIPPPFSNTVKLDENYMLPDDLRYMTPGGSPIENAQIRVYLKSDYGAGNLKSPVGFSTTNAYGRWSQPILVVPGYSYVVRFEKPFEFGPDTRTIIALSINP